MTTIFTIYAIDKEQTGGIIEFTLMNYEKSFFSSVKIAVEMNTSFGREFVVVPETLLPNGQRVSKRNHNRILQFSELCVKECYHVVDGRFHFKKEMIASVSLRNVLFIPSVLFPGLTIGFNHPPPASLCC